MPTLSLEQISGNRGLCRVKLNWENEGEIQRAAVAEFSYNLKPQDREDLRWYFEDYLQYPQDPAPAIARGVETRLAELGLELFTKVFRANEETLYIWYMVKNHLRDTAIEVMTDVREATTIPWELMIDPSTSEPLALTVNSFTRAYHQPSIRPKYPKVGLGPIRILLVICRPGGGDDIPFRSVASKVIRGLSQDANSPFQLDVLRPPTFDRLEQVLREAKKIGRPYHIVHFDGHGIYADQDELGVIKSVLSKRKKIASIGHHTGPRGYVLFENPSIEQNIEPIDGNELGNLLTETEVPILVLNACRSAFAESPDQPVEDEDIERMDPHSRVRAFGSLAQEVVDAGVSGVVAMRYVVYVVTAAQFIARFYAGLVQGQTLGQAATLGRKHLHDQPWRDLGFEPRKLQDWPVPVIYGAGHVSLFPPQVVKNDLEIKIHEAGDIPSRGYIDPQLPPSSDIGFFGRDETLLAIDQAFNAQNVVLLHSYAGNGKTATAAEFARWYSLTGGVKGPILFTSFENYMPLPRVLEKIGLVFGKTLERSGIQWLALSEAKKKALALIVLRQVPVLWIWDNIEPVNGFPAGTRSQWSEDEQRELAEFLRLARETKAKFLLTSRRDENNWLQMLTQRITIPSMPMLERLELAQAIASRHGRKLTSLEAWRPLLAYSQGNPMVITILVSQALRDELESKAQIQRFVEKLISGERAFQDDAEQGRSQSLGASLNYGFQQAFCDKELKVLALLQFFQGEVDVDALEIMCEQGHEWSLEGIQDVTEEEVQRLMDRAGEIGQLRLLGNGYYGIHPALPWFFHRLFQDYYKGQENNAIRAFVHAIGSLGNLYIELYMEGENVINILEMEESNLLYARRLALDHGFLSEVIGTMQALKVLYRDTGRLMEWNHLVQEIRPFFVDSETEGPLPGLEEYWVIVISYLVNIATEAKQLDEARRLEGRRVAWTRQDADPALSIQVGELDGEAKDKILSYAASLFDLARIQDDLHEDQCIQNYSEAFELAMRIGARQQAATCAMHLGQSYRRSQSKIRDLTESNRWYLEALNLYNERDLLGRGRIYMSLGMVAYERFKQVFKAGMPQDDKRRKHLSESLDFYDKALKLIPEYALRDLATLHSEMGSVYYFTGSFSEAANNYQEAIKYTDALGDIYRGAEFRLDCAGALFKSRRFQSALDYANDALERFKECGPEASKDIIRAQTIVSYAEEMLADMEKEL